MKNALNNKFKESTIAILPILLIVVILGLTIIPMSWQMIVQFVLSCVLLIIGMAMFTHGADTAMFPIGSHIGSYLSKSTKIWLMLLCGFALGIVITIAEPDLAVLASQVGSINHWLFIAIVGMGVGLFMLIGVLRTLFNIPLNIILLISYGAIFILSIFVPPEFVPLSFDSGSVTTGPISVPFLMAFGLGLVAVRSSKSSSGDSNFGLVALGSAGPILAVMILGLFVDPNTLAGSSEAIANTPTTFVEILFNITSQIPHYIGQVAIVLLPILAFFLIFQVTALKLPKQELMRILIGILFVFVGITLFFTGVNVGFMPVGNLIGASLASFDANWIFIPIALGIGMVIVLAEPAVHVLSNQVEKMTDGKISKKVILISMSIGVGLSLALCALRVLLQFSIFYVLIPAYIIAIILAFIVPKIFTGIAFDSGGVATGAMATTFVLPMFMGACNSLGASTMLYGFGTLAFIAVTPLLTIQTLGLIVKIANNKKLKNTTEEITDNKHIEIIEFD